MAAAEEEGVKPGMEDVRARTSELKIAPALGGERVEPGKINQRVAVEERSVWVTGKAASRTAIHTSRYPSCRT